MAYWRRRRGWWDEDEGEVENDIRHGRAIAQYGNDRQKIRKSAQESTVLETIYLVQSSCDPSEWYRVSKDEQYHECDCEVKCSTCGVCQGVYNCTCPDAGKAVDYCCKHTHAVVMWKNSREQGEEKSDSEDEDQSDFDASGSDSDPEPIDLDIKEQLLTTKRKMRDATNEEKSRLLTALRGWSECLGKSLVKEESVAIDNHVSEEKRANEPAVRAIKREIKEEKVDEFPSAKMPKTEGIC